MPLSPLQLICKDPNVSPAFASAIQLSFPRADFQNLLKSDDADSHNWSADSRLYVAGGRS